MKKNQHLKAVFILLLSLFISCTDKTPKPVLLDRNYFVGTWALDLTLNPSFCNGKVEITFLENGSVQQLGVAGVKVPWSPAWIFDAEQRQINMANDNKKYYIVEYSQNQFVWQERGDKYEGNYQRFNRK